MNLRSALALLALLSVAAIPLSAGPVSICDGVVGNLVTNCGFETGVFAPWIWTGNTGATGVTTGYAYSGTYGAQLGPVGSDGFLTQTLPTVAGTVNLSFYLMSPGGTTNDFNRKLEWDRCGAQPSECGRFCVHAVHLRA
jgi:hypothetical protein